MDSLDGLIRIPIGHPRGSLASRERRKPRVKDVSRRPVARGASANVSVKLAK
jgi:hypothetical protein